MLLELKFFHALVLKIISFYKLVYLKKNRYYTVLFSFAEMLRLTCACRLNVIYYPRQSFRSTTGAYRHIVKESV